MRRTLLIVLVALAAVVLLIVVGLASPARRVAGLETEAWRPLPSIAFSPFPRPVGIAPRQPVHGRPVTPTVRPDVRATPTPRPVSGRISGAQHLFGQASWYCLPGVSSCMARHPTGGPYAAAGPALRAALGPGWRNRRVRICAGGHCVSVILADWCRCSANRVIDLYSDMFDRLAPLGAGVLKVEVLW